MCNRPLVSILVLVYGVEKYIERCARSIFEQTYNHYEVVFVNDCTQDDSIGILKRVMSDYPSLSERVRIVEHSRNLGQAAARNTAVANAIGDFVMFVDSDDWIEPNALELLVQKQLATDADIVSGWGIAHYNDHQEELREPEYVDKEDMLLHMIELTLDHVLWRRLIRHSLYTEHNIQCVDGINIGEDHCTLPRLLYYARTIEYVNQVIYHYNCIKEHKSSSEVVYRGRENDLAAIDTLNVFFDGKNQRCCEVLHRVKAECLIKYLEQCIRFRNSLQFRIVSKRLFEISPKYLQQVGIASMKDILICKNYYVWRINDFYVDLKNKLH